MAYHPIVIETSDAEERIEVALRRVITDTDGRFDECLVDNLFESIKRHRKHHIESTLSLHLVPLEFEHYIVTNGSVNLARLLKYHSSVSSTGPLLDFAVLKAFINYLPQIVMRGKPPEILPALSHLLNMIKTDIHPGYQNIRLVVKTRYDAPFGIKNIIHLLKYLLETSRVYHIQNLAKTIFLDLILRFPVQKTSEHQKLQFEDSIKETTLELLCAKDSRLMHLALIELFECATRCLYVDTTLIKSLERIAMDRYEQLVKQPNLSTPNFNLLVKCVSYIETRPNPEILEQMMARENLEAVIMYVTSGSWEPIARHKGWPRNFILYPILARCLDDNVGALIDELIISDQEKDFIERNLKDKHVQQCLTYLHQTMNRLEPYSGLIIKSDKLTLRALEIVLKYLECNFNCPKDLKNLSLCCETIITDQMKIFNEKTNINWLKKSGDVILNILNRIDYNSFQNKPIFLQSLQSLARTSYMQTILQNNEREKDKFIEIAFKVADPDMLNELTQSYIQVVQWSRTPLEDSALVKYSELILKHILPIARSTNNHELIAHAISLLIHVNCHSKLKTMQDDLQMIIGDILTENSHVETITHNIIRTIHDLEAKGSQGVFERTKECDHIYKGICKVLMSDSLAADEELLAHAIIYRIVDSILLNGELPVAKWERLARIGVLELLYDIHSRSAYEHGDLMQAMTKRCLNSRPQLSLTKAEFERIFIKPHTAGAEDIVQFFFMTSSEFEESLMHLKKNREPRLARGMYNRNKLGLNSYLDDILNDDLVAQMAECY